MSETPEKITLPADAIAALMGDPALMREMETVSEQGTVELIAWLDAHGLRWRAGGSDPMAAFMDAAENGGLECGLEFGGPRFEESGWTDEPYTPNRAQRRKNARKARRRR